MIDLGELKKHLILGSDSADSAATNVFTIRADGSGKTYLTNDEPGSVNTLASWSYDGSKIVYTHNDSTDPLPHIWSMDADGSNKKELTFGSLSGVAPTFSPDGNSILFTSYAESTDPVVGLELWVMSAEGAGAHPLTHTTVGGFSKDGAPLRWSMFGTYSPDGTKIAYASTQSGSSQIWIMNNDGTEKREVTFIEDANAPDANSPSWSPDGTDIAYAGGFAGKGTSANPFTINIYTVKPDGSGRTQLTYGLDSLTSDIPTWTPDGQYIYFGSIRNGPMETWVMRQDGTDQRALFQSNYYPSRRPVAFDEKEADTSASTQPDCIDRPDALVQASDLASTSDDSDLIPAQPSGFDFQDIDPSGLAAASPDLTVRGINASAVVENGNVALAADLSFIRMSGLDDTGDIGGGADGPF